VRTAGEDAEHLITSCTIKIGADVAVRLDRCSLEVDDLKAMSLNRK
jgi:hypothetical protein